MGEPTDESELDMRDIVPRVGETAETDNVTVLARERRTGGGRLLDALLEVSDEAEPIVVCEGSRMVDA